MRQNQNPCGVLAYEYYFCLLSQFPLVSGISLKRIWHSRQVTSSMFVVVLNTFMSTLAAQYGHEA